MSPLFIRDGYRTIDMKNCLESYSISAGRLTPGGDEEGEKREVPAEHFMFASHLVVVTKLAKKNSG